MAALSDITNITLTHEGDYHQTSVTKYSQARCDNASQRELNILKYEAHLATMFIFKEPQTEYFDPAIDCEPHEIEYIRWANEEARKSNKRKANEEAQHTVTVNANVDVGVCNVYRNTGSDVALLKRRTE